MKDGESSHAVLVKFRLKPRAPNYPLESELFVSIRKKFARFRGRAKIRFQ